MVESNCTKLTGLAKIKYNESESTTDLTPVDLKATPPKLLKVKLIFLLNCLLIGGIMGYQFFHWKSVLEWIRSLVLRIIELFSVWILLCTHEEVPSFTFEVYQNTMLKQLHVSLLTTLDF